MPDWAIGDVTVCGTKNAVSAFARRFIADQECMNADTRIFGQSYVYSTRDEVDSLIESSFQNTEENEMRTVVFQAGFAWAADYCLISNWPVKEPERYISLSEACIEDHVSTEVNTLILELYLEENIICTADGALTSRCADMLKGKCNHCGAIQSVASFEDLTEVECFECGRTGFSVYEEEERKCH